MSTKSYKKMVTVLMPVYNGEKYLAESINSILNQTFIDFELIIINDGSTDNSEQIIKSYLDSRIVYIRNINNLRLIRTLNKGIALSKGKYIARMDCDDVSDITRLAYQLQYMESNLEIGVLGTAIKIIDGDGNKKGTLVMPVQDGMIRWNMNFGCPFAHPTVMMRKDALEALSTAKSGEYYSLDAYQSEDYDLWYRMSKITKLHNLKQPLLMLRKHGLNESIVNGKAVNQKSLSIIKEIIYEATTKMTPDESLSCLGNQSEPKSSEEAIFLLGILRDLFENIQKKSYDKGVLRVIKRDYIRRIIQASQNYFLNKQIKHKILKIYLEDPFYAFAYSILVTFRKAWHENFGKKNE